MCRSWVWTRRLKRKDTIDKSNSAMVCLLTYELLFFQARTLPSLDSPAASPTSCTTSMSTVVYCSSMFLIVDVPIILVMINGNPITIPEFIGTFPVHSLDWVDTAIEAFYPGQFGGEVCFPVVKSSLGYCGRHLRSIQPRWQTPLFRLVERWNPVAQYCNEFSLLVHP